MRNQTTSVVRKYFRTGEHLALEALQETTRGCEANTLVSQCFCGGSTGTEIPLKGEGFRTGFEEVGTPVPAVGGPPTVPSVPQPEVLRERFGGYFQGER